MKKTAMSMNMMMYMCRMCMLRCAHLPKQSSVTA